MVINHNINALNAHRNSALNTTATGKSMEKLSSGLRINRAADDAAGLAISEKMRGQIKGLTQAQRNAQDGISYIQTMEGALNEVSDMLTRAKELITEAKNGTYNSTQVSNISDELGKLSAEINNIVENTKFNGITMGKTVTIQIGDEDSRTMDISADSTAINNLKNLGTTKLSASVGTDGKYAGTQLSKVESLIDNANKVRSDFGALQNRLEHTSNNLGTTVENLTSSESRIRDTDMASEMAKFSSKNIITQASQAMLSQANQLQQNVLSLLR